MPIVLVVNHWGGIPSTLVSNLRSTQSEWAQENEEGLLLADVDPRLSLDATVGTLFVQARRAGYRTVLLGATGADRDATLPSSPRVYDAPELPDPRTALLASRGVDECSAIDGETFRGSAEVHDVLVVREALRLLHERGGERDARDEPSSGGNNLLLWINLLSCRDVDRLRFSVSSSSSSSPEVDVCRGQLLSSFDRRQLPASVSAYFAGVSDVCRRADRLRHGEDAKDFARAKSAEAEYATLLHHAWDILSREDVRVHALLEEARARGAQMAHTATHSLSLGEHGVRGGFAPTHPCCTTFWCSTLSTRGETLPSRLADFARLACGLPIASSTSLVAPVTRCTLSDVAFARVCCRLHDHVYACVWQTSGRDGGDGVEYPRLLCVFDLATDPEETSNVLQDLSHVEEELRAQCRPWLLTQPSSSSRRPPPVAKPRLPPPVAKSGEGTNESNKSNESNKRKTTVDEETSRESARSESRESVSRESVRSASASREEWGMPRQTEIRGEDVKSVDEEPSSVSRLPLARTNVRRKESKLNSMHR